MPDELYVKLKAKSAERKTTMRDLLIHALEASLGDRPAGAFRLRDASVGKDVSGSRNPMTAGDINAAIDGLRERSL